MGLRQRVIDGLTDLAGDLLEVGIKSSPDPGQVAVSKAGAAWLHPRTYDPSRLAGAGTLRVEVWLVITDLDDPWAELLTLTDLVDKALSIPTVVAVDDIELDAQLALPDNSSCPAALLLVDLDV